MLDNPTQIDIKWNKMGGHKGKTPVRAPPKSRKPGKAPPMPPLQNTNPEKQNRKQVECPQLSAAFSLNSAELVPDVISPEATERISNLLEQALVYSDPEIEKMRHRLHKEFLINDVLMGYMKNKGLPSYAHTRMPHRSDSFLKDVLSDFEAEQFLEQPITEEDGSPSTSDGSGSSTITGVSVGFCERTGANEFEDQPDGLAVQVITPELQVIEGVKDLAGRSIEEIIDVQVVDATPGTSRELVVPTNTTEKSTQEVTDTDNADLDSSNSSFKSLALEQGPKKDQNPTPEPSILEKISHNLDCIDDITAEDYRDFKELYTDLNAHNAVNVVVRIPGKERPLDFFIPDFVQNGMIANSGLEAMILGTLIQEKFIDESLQLYPRAEQSVRPSFDPMSSPDPPIRPPEKQRKLTMAELETAISSVQIQEKPMVIHKPKNQQPKTKAPEKPVKLPTLPPPKEDETPKQTETKIKEYKWIGYTRDKVKVCGRTQTERKYKLGIQSAADAATLVRLSNQPLTLRRTINVNRVYIVEENLNRK